MPDRKTYNVRILLLTAVCMALTIAGCATATPDPMEARLAAMPDDQLIGYYQGLNDRIKDAESATREADRQGTIRQDDQLARIPYIVGGEVWDLERRRERVHRELVRRHLKP